ncbi:CsbD family protein [Thiothrix litoralis]|uniref:CsbD family protein n=2 Tax=Thiothrix litoralis TaxID=2891210 RepID=A0ABX7WXP4_9GAMM|nr:CsbD family protein [Thiothrix litoralis]
MSNYISANWHQVKGKVREQFGKLTDDDLLEVAGRVETLVGKLQERYDISLEEAEKRVTGLHLDKDGMELETSVLSTQDGEVSAEVSPAEAEKVKREQKERTENYIHRS